MKAPVRPIICRPQLLESSSTLKSVHVREINMRDATDTQIGSVPKFMIRDRVKGLRLSSASLLYGKPTGNSSGCGLETAPVKPIEEVAFGNIPTAIHDFHARTKHNPI